jgi:N-acetylmuramoyl-L-alanine amidase
MGPPQTFALLLETEFIDVLAVDQLLNTNANRQQVRQAIIDALGDALQDDLLHNPQ